MEETLEITNGTAAWLEVNAERVIGTVLAVPGEQAPNGNVSTHYEIVVGDEDTVYYRDRDEIQPATEDESKEASDEWLRCVGCEEWLEADDGDYTYAKSGDVVCHGCEESDLSSASTVVIFDPQKFEDEPRQILVSNYYTVDREYFEEVTDLEISREWKSSSGYRGHYETKVTGFVEVLDGWTTGWIDETVTRKQRFNEWIEVLSTDPEARMQLPCKVVLCIDPTSNVFSTAVGISVQEDERETFVEWLNGSFDDLYNALT
jgi:hypothetical protein